MSRAKEAMLARDARCRTLELRDLLAGESDAGAAAVSGDSGGVDAILAELDRLHAVEFVKEHLAGLRDTLQVENENSMGRREKVKCVIVPNASRWRTATARTLPSS